ncbi:MAG TPA: DUF1592 domain-containing protein [Polyangia bacterium]|nr:DUF1592 domain-containing protein [Polyangia bacterium]
MKGTATRTHLALLLALAGTAACNGQIGDGAGATSNTNTGSGGSEPIPPADADVGRVSIHRLNNLEYDNTIRDLLGVTSSARTTFISDEKGDFDNNADEFTVSDARYEQYYDSANTIATAAFADPTIASRILTCTQADTAAEDSTCTRTIISQFGARAWRRPLTTAEVDRLVKLASDARAATATFRESIQQVVTTMLASPDFLYRIEADPNPASPARHALGPYELATRLSYLTWSSMPDARLFQLAASGDILKDDVLTAELDRGLADAKATFTSSFAGQWLGMRDLLSHQVEATAYPTWDDSIRLAMAGEGLAYFGDFLANDRDFSTFFTTDMNFVNAPLAKLYGIPNVTGDSLVKVTDTNDARRGFLGLGTFLTVSSFSYRTSPTLRGRWVLMNLMCQTINKPNNVDIPKIDSDNASDPNAQDLNVAAKLAAHRDNPTCSPCHNILDPIGLGLESYDAIGAFRTAYPNGDPVMTAGTLPSGQSFSGIQELSGILAQDPRFLDCAAQKTLTYALGRAMTTADDPFLKQIRWLWTHGGTSFRALLKAVVLNDTFRYRRGEGPASDTSM